MDEITVHVLRILKTKTSFDYRYCYKAIIPVSTAKRLGFYHKEGVLLKTLDGYMFPTVIIVRQRKNRKNSYIYSFTIPKKLVKHYKKDIKLDVISISGRREKHIQNRNPKLIWHFQAPGANLQGFLQ